MEEVVNIISTLGFPIACAVALFYFYTKFINQQMENYAKREEALMVESRAREERFGTQLEKFSESLNSFNLTLIKIDTRLEELEKAIKGE